MAVSLTILILLAGYYVAFLISWPRGRRKSRRTAIEALIILLGGLVTAMIFSVGPSVASFASAGALAFFLVLIALPMSFIVVGFFAGSVVGRLKRHVDWWRPVAAMALLAPALAMVLLTLMLPGPTASEAALSSERTVISQLEQPGLGLVASDADQATW